MIYNLIYDDTAIYNLYETEDDAVTAVGGGIILFQGSKVECLDKIKNLQLIDLREKEGVFEDEINAQILE